MVPRPHMRLDLRVRDLPFVLIGMGGGALALREGAPAEITVFVVVLIMFDFRLRFWRRQA